MSCTAPDLGEEGSHEDCPYKREEEGSDEDCAYGEKRRAATRTVPTAKRRGQSRGLRLRRKEEGSHEDCAYGEKRRAVTRTAPTVIWRGLQTCASGHLESHCAPRLVSKRKPQQRWKTVYLLASVLLLYGLHMVYRFNS